MATLVEQASKAEDAPDPQAGVIGDARGRQLRRRRRIAATLASGLLMASAVAGWAAGWFGAGSEHGGAKPGLAAFQRRKLERKRVRAHISPALEGGSYGWAITESNGAGCCTLPRENASGTAVGAFAGWTGNSYEEAATALLADRVAGIVAQGQRAAVLTLARLPYGLRIAQIRFKRHARAFFGEGGPAIVALDSQSKPIGYLTRSEGGVEAGVRWWQKPQASPRGPCQLTADGLRGLQPEWGHVAVAVRAHTPRIMGRAFFSCIDTEYYLHRWPLDAAILLDAEHPGRTPAPIPGMRPLAGAPGVFAAPGDWHGELAATRRGHAWLVVAGGSGLTQRLDVLRHLTATVSFGHNQSHSYGGRADVTDARRDNKGSRPHRSAAGRY